MEIKNKEVRNNISTENPFENCLLDREQYAKVLTSILANYKSGFVLAIDNEWGTGKTTFVEMWMKYLEKRKYRTIYFNAWENDFQDEVIIAILSELKKLQGDSEELFIEVLEKALPLLKSVGIELIKHAIGKATGEKTLEIIAKGVGEYSMDSLEMGLKDYEEKKTSIIEFRNCLAEFVNNVDNENPIVFVIDELDRCRPNYAVEVLEKMKHLFNVKGVVFVLSIDKVQLGHAIRGVYGSESIDSDEYLRRFIDIEFSLPTPSIKDYTLHLTNHFGLRGYYGNSERLKHAEFQNDLESLIYMIDLLQLSSNLNLRQIEKILGQYSIVVNTMAYNQYANPMPILFIILLKIINKDGFYQKFASRKLSLQELLDKTLELFYPLLDEHKINYFIWFQAQILFYYWIYLKEKDKSIILYVGDPNNDNFKISVNNKADQEHNKLSDSIRRFVTRSGFRSNNNLISQIIPHIELTKVVS